MDRRGTELRRRFGGGDLTVAGIHRASRISFCRAIRRSTASRIAFAVFDSFVM
jgi:hypothetical protein